MQSDVVPDPRHQDRGDNDNDAAWGGSGGGGAHGVGNDVPYAALDNGDEET